MKCKDIPSKAEILAKIRVGGSACEKMIDKLAEGLIKCLVFEKTVTNYVLKNRGNIQDAEDTRLEGLAQLVNNLYANKYGGKSSIENYAFGICKNIWNNRRRKNERIKLQNTEAWNSLDQQTALTPESQISEEQIWSIVEQINVECKELLMFVHKGYSYKEISQKSTLAVQTIKNKVASCRDKLRNLFKNNTQII